MKFKSLLSLLIGITILTGSFILNDTKAIATINETPMFSYNTDSTDFNYNGWKFVNNDWYYYEDGVLTTKWLCVDGNLYFFDAYGTMLTGWINTSGIWYYLNDSGVMLSNTTVGIYVLDATGACINPNGENPNLKTNTNPNTIKTRSTSEIKSILKDDYGFVDYNDQVLLNTDGEVRSEEGNYVNNQILFGSGGYNAQQLLIAKRDSETMNAVKDVLKIVFNDNQDKANEAYSLIADYLKSGEYEKIYDFYGKTIKFYESSGHENLLMNIS